MVRRVYRNRSRVSKAIHDMGQITNIKLVLKDELETTMRMVGVNNLLEVHPGLLNTGAVDHLIPGAREEHPYAKWRPKSLM